jgi:hypothetical protein
MRSCSLWGVPDIFVRKDIQFTNINLQKYNKEQGLEITAIKI